MKMRKPFVYALAAILYIVIIVLTISSITSFLPNENILIPMAMLGLFVLSAAVMGFLFLSEPWFLYMENKKSEAVTFFARQLGIFFVFVVLLLILLFILK